MRMLCEILQEVQEECKRENVKSADIISIRAMERALEIYRDAIYAGMMKIEDGWYATSQHTFRIRKYNRVKDGDFRCDACSAQGDCDALYGPKGKRCPLRTDEVYTDKED